MSLPCDYPEVGRRTEGISFWRFPSKSGLPPPDQGLKLTRQFGEPNWQVEMKPSESLQLHRLAILAIVEANRARHPGVFGLVPKGEDTVVSDINILIDPTPDTTLFDIGAIRVDP